MGASKEDMRSTRTRRACKRALLDLMRETDFQGITVTDIASRAEISRVTFYRHYPTTADVLADIAKDVMDEYAERRRGIVYPDASLRTGVEQRCLLFYSHFADHAEYYSAMLGRHGIPSFERELQDMRVSLFCGRYSFRPARGQSEAAARLRFRRAVKPMSTPSQRWPPISPTRSCLTRVRSSSARTSGKPHPAPHSLRLGLRCGHGRKQERSTLQSLLRRSG